MFIHQQGEIKQQHDLFASDLQVNHLHNLQVNHY